MKKIVIIIVALIVIGGGITGIFFSINKKKARDIDDAYQSAQKSISVAVDNAGDILSGFPSFEVAVLSPESLLYQAIKTDLGDIWGDFRILTMNDLTTLGVTLGSEIKPDDRIIIHKETGFVYFESKPMSANKITENLPLTAKPLKGEEKTLINPYMGYVAWATDLPESNEVTLAYVGMTHRELEPQKGVYAFEEMEKNQNFQKLKERGIKIVFRVMFDMPNSEKSPSIADWLVNETGRDGTPYDRGDSGGYSPDFANPLVIETHQKLLNAIGQRYNGEDSIIAFVQIGTMGRYGEWYYGEDLAPPSVEVQKQYVDHYVAAFPNTKILMRRAFTFAADNKLGMFNDMLGDISQSDRFVSWITEGEEGDSYRLVPMPDFWENAPCGGEFAQGEPELYLNNGVYSITKKQVADSHMTFIGPCSPVPLANYPEDSRTNALDLLSNLGYRLRVSSCSYPRKMIPGNQYNIAFTWQNDGLAPLYYDLPVIVSLYNKDGQQVLTQTVSGWKTSAWLSGESKVLMPFSPPADLPAGGYEIRVGMTDKDNKTPVKLDMYGLTGGQYPIGTVNISK